MKRPVVVLAAALGVAALAACSRPGAPDAAGPASPPPQPAETVFAVDTTRAVRGELLGYLLLNGDVVTRASVDVYPEVAGKLSRLLVRLGEYVVKDQVIAEVDPSRPGMTYVPSPVKSPISGTITALPAQEGATVSQAVPVARIGRLDELEIKVQVAERFISKIRPGLAAVVRFDSYPGERFRAVLTETSPVVDPQTRTLEVRLRLEPPDRRIKAGMFASVKIITDRRQGIVKVPSEVLVRRFGTTYAFVVNDGVAQRRRVNPGMEIDGKVEVIEGLEPGDEVVLRGQTLLEDGAKVRVANRYPGLPEVDVID